MTTHGWVTSSPSATEGPSRARHTPSKGVGSVCRDCLRRNQISRSDLPPFLNSFLRLAHGPMAISTPISTHATSPTISPHNSQATLLSLIAPDFRSSRRPKSSNCILGRRVVNENKPESGWKSTAFASTKTVIDMEGTLQASSFSTPVCCRRSRHSCYAVRGRSTSHPS